MFEHVRADRSVLDDVLLCVSRLESSTSSYSDLVFLGNLPVISSRILASSCGSKFIYCLDASV